MSTPVKAQYRVSPHLAFFLIHKMQFAVGVLGFQRFIAQSAGHDAWISVILSGISVHQHTFGK